MIEVAHFEWLCDLVVDNTQQLIRNAIRNENFKYKPNKSDFGVFKKFVTYYQSKYKKAKITDAFLIEYMNKQFEFMFYRNEVTDLKLNNVRLTWFFGDKAIKRWEEKLAKKQQSSATKFKKNELSLLSKKYAITLNWLEVVEFEELEKARFHNTEAGIVWCCQNTNLFNPVSPVCRGCIFAGECKSLLRQEYPQIFKLRLENDTTPSQRVFSH